MSDIKLFHIAKNKINIPVIDILNEESYLTDKFEPGKVVTCEKIIKEAILKLISYKLLF